MLLTAIYLEELPLVSVGFISRLKMRSLICKTYRINRLDDPDAIGYQNISRFAIEKFLENAPFFSEGCHRKSNRRYPKHFEDIENQFPPGVYYEYPTKHYPYNQNAKGVAYEILPEGGRGRRVYPGYIRTITDRFKNVKGVCYHPSRDRSHVRAKELNRRVRLRLFTWTFHIPMPPTLTEVRDFVSAVFARARTLWEYGAQYLGYMFRSILFLIPGWREGHREFITFIAWSYRRNRLWVMVSYVTGERIGRHSMLELPRGNQGFGVDIRSDVGFVYQPKEYRLCRWSTVCSESRILRNITWYLGLFLALENNLVQFELTDGYTYPCFYLLHVRKLLLAVVERMSRKLSLFASKDKARKRHLYKFSRILAKRKGLQDNNFDVRILTPILALLNLSS